MSTSAFDASSSSAPQMDLLRVSTAGSVDDGKSTLIGRLLYDTKSVYEDQLEAVELASRHRGRHSADGVPDLALLTDGLRAEREQGITIDVAYRFFATPKRTFILADTPGHVQYTRNMVTGASTADLALVLIDASRGVQTQSRRHGFIASLLGLDHMVVVVNKMDLVGYSQATFEAIADAYRAFAAKLQIHDLRFIPVSALLGDNVVDRSENMPWYEGATVLHTLENVSILGDRNLRDFRFPVQTVFRPDPTFRGFAGTVASGVIRPGEEVMALPSGTRSRVHTLTTFDGDRDEARAGEAVVLTLEDEIAVSRGDMLVRPGNLPTVDTELEAMLCWMDEASLQSDRPYRLRHTTREVRAFVDDVVYRVNVDTLHRENASSLALNEIGRVHITASSPLFFDPYAANHPTGAFILIDPDSNATVAAGMIRGAAQTPDEVVERARVSQNVSPDVVWEGVNIPREAREQAQGHAAAVVWFTGLSGSGKTTIAREVERRLFERGVRTVVLDGDHVRHGLCGDLGFSPADRRENIRRVKEVAKLFLDTGMLTLCTFISPYAADRDRVRGLIPEGRFVEVHVEVDVETARQRDPKGLYARADRGEIRELTGVSAPYEVPEAAELTIRTGEMSVEEAADAVIADLEARGLLRSPHA